MVTVDKLGGSWVIVRGHGVNAPDEVKGLLMARDAALSSTREFWTGDGWAAQYGFAKQFTSKEDAETHLAQHLHEAS